MDRVIPQDVLDAARAVLEQESSCNIETIMDHCPHCGSFEMVPGDDESIWDCLVCGYYYDPNAGDNPYCPHTPLPHYSIGYRHSDPAIFASSKGIEEVNGAMPIDSLDESEAWLQAREQEGYEISKCVIVNEHGHVIWLRGTPRDWNFSGR